MKKHSSRLHLHGRAVFWYAHLSGREELSMASQEAALFGIGLAVVYLLYLLACFMVEMPESIKTVPVVGRYGKMLGWLALIGIGTAARTT